MTSGSRIKSIRLENAMLPPAGKPTAIPVNPADLVAVTCPECGGTIFSKGYVLKILPATHPQNSTRREQRLVAEVYYCPICGKAI